MSRLGLWVPLLFTFGAGMVVAAIGYLLQRRERKRRAVLAARKQ